MTNPYESPRAQESTHHRLLRCGKALLCIALAVFLFGLLGTIWGITSSFSKLAQTETASPADLADSISMSLAAAVLGLVLSLLFAVAGILLIVVARRNRGRQKDKGDAEKPTCHQQET